MPNLLSRKKPLKAKLTRAEDRAQRQPPPGSLPLRERLTDIQQSVTVNKAAKKASKAQEQAQNRARQVHFAEQEARRR